ncbi:MAG: GGDEF domain-containing protein, partial [Rhizobiaceae bacterium]|nr:GGDEF domain-containing protein [Rhizobiaceae bacterium]
YRAPILITAMPIIGSLQDFFGKRFLLDDARVSALTAVTPDRARAEIAVGPQGEIEVLSWQPPKPAADILYQSLPLILTVGIVLLAGAFFMIRTSQAAAEMLVGRERQMRHAATHDFLTGLANRALLEPEFRTLAEKESLMVVCVDLDGFKGVNDSHGHAMGDELLKVVASRLRTGTRETDRLFRLGGDEFAILMPNISMAETEEVCRRLSASLSQPIALPKCEISIGASFGISQVADKAATCDTALGAADGALYDAKSLGRGSVVTASTVASRRPERTERMAATARR